MVHLLRISKGRDPPAQALPQTGTHQTPSSCVGTVPKSILHNLFANNPDSVFFHHAQLLVINHLAEGSGPTDFWYYYAMPLAHSITPLKYAICALGAAHWHFLVSDPGNSHTSKDLILRSEIAAIERCNAAIEHIQSFSQSFTSDMDAYVLMMCCVIFVCIENLLGRYSESVRHLRAGSSLLSSRSAPWATLSAAPDLKNALFIVFYKLGHDSAIFNNNNALGNLASGFPVPDMGSRYEPFASYEEASKSLRQVDLIYNISFASAVAAPDHSLITANESPRQEYLSLRSAREALSIWNQRFKILQQSSDQYLQQQPQNHQPGFAKLLLDQSIWGLLTEMTTFKDPVSVGSCESVLSKIESLVPMCESQRHRTFAIGSDIVPVLALICVSCKDRDTRLRSVATLRSLGRREGVWDSGQVAEACEALIMDRYMGQQDTKRNGQGAFVQR
ncbi:hypothetical protein P170DRAFT_460797 [Aspergillus steynii IBT 23096]|uniref:C6 zinc finger domain protein n=1 Tax=Aspergillus steynii IBT 23096 TaxID=1392250 RepID=A0A2I2GPF7_9EURO|nr:uncharacterized protein P170DRAFT_460797 [Aspergillus steynii IBT 23096]PLB54752.1 hypothetical protein P170DRAFT_460797 [Aspergillus steynii IBT 23096]